MISHVYKTSGDSKNNIGIFIERILDPFKTNATYIFYFLSF